MVGHGVMLAEMQGGAVGWGSGRRVTHSVVLLVREPEEWDLGQC